MSDKITILTPTYNRCNYLEKLYKSLKMQTLKSFIWLVIDDGSTDATADYIKSLKSENEFEIVYVYKENGGKHTALNLGFEMLTTYLTFIVDSDDYLKTDAIEKIIEQIDVVRDNDLSGMCFLRGYTNGKCIGRDFGKEKFIENDINIRFKKNITGDKAEVWRSDILKRYRFPVFEGEKFQGENYIWWDIALKYDMLYINEIIYITEYLDNGLTKSGKKMRIKNPCGGMVNSIVGMKKGFPMKIRIKYSVLYNVYSFFARKKITEYDFDKVGLSLVILTRIPAYFIYLYWKKKYL